MHPADRIIYQIYVPAFAGQGPHGTTPALTALQRFTRHLRRLGVNTVMLTPIGPADSEHRYDCTNYFVVDPALAGSAGPKQANRAFGRLVDVWRSAGLDVIIDLVLNHASPHYPLEELSAGGRPRRREARTADEKRWGFGYWDQTHEPTKEFLLRVVRHWLESFPVAGVRLDYLPGLEAGFRQRVLETIRQVRSGAFVLGECWRGHDVLAKFYSELAEPGLDSLLDFPFQGAVRDVLAWNAAPAVLGRVLRKAYEASGERCWPCWFLDNHDQTRLADAVRGDGHKLTLAATIQLAQSGPVCVFYGDEIALQAGSPLADGFTSFGRIAWPDADAARPMLEYYRRLCRCRDDNPALRRGQSTILKGPAGCLVQIKHTDQQVVVLTANLTDRAVRVRIGLDRFGQSAANAGARELLSAQHVKLEPARLADGQWTLPCRLPAWSARLWHLIDAG
jgi:glycosidase